VDMPEPESAPGTSAGRLMACLEVAGVNGRVTAGLLGWTTAFGFALAGLT
jgi:hypothetical protein